MHLTIAMLTYRRNEYLTQVIPELLAQADDLSGPETTVGILIVDNDPRAGARAVVETARRAALESEALESADESGAGDRAEPAGSTDSAAASGLAYVHEPEPGIVAGRNRALSEAHGSDALVFIDDDEIPSPGWLAALVSTWRDHGCAAVTGPTPPTFEVPPSAWVTASGAFDSWEAADGAQVRSADTGNLLLDLGVVESLGLRFDPRYGLTGGEDSLFTRQLTRAGGVIRFAAGAVVTKRVPAARATRAWVLERSLRSGSSWARVRIDTAGPAGGGASGTLVRLRLRLGYGAKGLAKAGVDGARGGVARARGNVPAQARYEVSSRGGLGMVVGALGGHVREYGRPRSRRGRGHTGGKSA
ncbi:glycosyltransferase [Actinomyces viscosus]|uniref:Mycofactocin system glycosyltransferase n=2 Tax=Actinomyces viscosus TaxID=1656 RepID=A0A3S4WLD1_ACTVI|nr:glycosyltransferase [Actinomyces viscosus]TFH52723.1 glycosyltransferase [Actinomyces viscosus]VEI18302.1 mycofactocin system glycosyltransferase [Actinomyces viscosus]